MGLIQVVDAAGIPQGIGGGVLDEQGRTKTERDIAAGLEDFRKKHGPESLPDINARRLVDGDGHPLEVPLAARKALVDFTWNREPPADWQAHLDRLFPPNERISWLEIVWVAADEVLSRTYREGRVVGERVKVDPVQRWVLFQISRQVPSAARVFLEGEPPHPKHNRIPLMREQWDLYRAERTRGCWAQPYWIIQGERGGHKRRFTKHEQKILKAEQLPADPPEAGALEYAPFDNRVIDKIIAFEHVQFWNRAVEFEERGADQLDAEEKEAARSCRGWLLTWLESQVEAQMDSTPIGAIKTDRDTKPLDVDLERHLIVNAE